MQQNEEIEIQLLADCQEYVPYLAGLWYEQISKHWVPDASVERAKQNLIRHANKNQLPMTLVALQNIQPIGMASLRENDGIQPDLTPWLGSLVVDPACRRHKIGEKLINAIKEKAFFLEYKQPYLLAFDLTIPIWYKKLGWKPIGSDQLFGHPVTVMQIELNK